MMSCCCEQTKKMDVYVESKVFDDELISRQPAFAAVRGTLFMFNEGWRNSLFENLCH